MPLPGPGAVTTTMERLVSMYSFCPGPRRTRCGHVRGIPGDGIVRQLRTPSAVKPVDEGIRRRLPGVLGDDHGPTVKSQPRNTSDEPQHPDRSRCPDRHGSCSFDVSGTDGDDDLHVVLQRLSIRILLSGWNPGSRRRGNRQRLAAELRYSLSPNWLMRWRDVLGLQGQILVVVESDLHVQYLFFTHHIFKNNIAIYTSPGGRWKGVFLFFSGSQISEPKFVKNLVVGRLVFPDIMGYTEKYTPIFAGEKSPFFSAMRFADRPAHSLHGLRKASCRLPGGKLPGPYETTIFQGFYALSHMHKKINQAVEGIGSFETDSSIDGPRTLPYAWPLTDETMSMYRTPSAMRSCGILMHWCTGLKKPRASRQSRDARLETAEKAPVFPEKMP